VQNFIFALSLSLKFPYVHISFQWGSFLFRFVLFFFFSFSTFLHLSAFTTLTTICFVEPTVPTHHVLGLNRSSRHMTFACGVSTCKSCTFYSRVVFPFFCKLRRTLRCCGGPRHCHVSPDPTRHGPVPSSTTIDIETTYVVMRRTTWAKHPPHLFLLQDKWHAMSDENAGAHEFDGCLRNDDICLAGIIFRKELSSLVFSS
jgi:hypothetical protein